MAGALVIAEDLISKAQAGEKLSREERRHAVAFLLMTAPDVSNVEMARMFQCDEGTIRFDIKQIKTDKADLVREDTDVKLVIADMLAARDRALLKVAAGTRKMEVEKRNDTQTYLAYVKAALDIHVKVTEALQNMGWLPKNLGALTVNKQVYKSYVQPMSGLVETRPLDLFDDLREGETLEDKLRRDAEAQKQFIQDAEYVDIPQLPASTGTGNAEESTTRVSESEGQNKQS